MRPYPASLLSIYVKLKSFWQMFSQCHLDRFLSLLAPVVELGLLRFHYPVGVGPLHIQAVPNFAYDFTLHIFREERHLRSVHDQDLDLSCVCYHTELRGQNDALTMLVNDATLTRNRTLCDKNSSAKVVFLG